MYSSMLPPGVTANQSSHSSPASSKSVGSPQERPLDLAGASPKIAPPAFNMAQVHVPSPPRPFDYPFTTQPHPSASMGQPLLTPVSALPSQEWAVPSPNDPNRNMLYPSPSQDPNNLLFGNGQAPPNGFYYPFDEAGALAMDGALPNPAFAASGLPFTGLDFIRNYPPDGYASTLDDSLWQAIDPRAFQFENEAPWLLADLPPIEEQGGHQ
jgi:hypothetical protein